MNAKVQATLPADTRTAVLDAVYQGVSDARAAAAEREDSAAANAAKVIANIPTRIREATAEGVRTKTSRFRVSLMPIGVDDCSEYLKTSSTDMVGVSILDRDRLVGTAQLVWDHCVAAGLHVFVAHTKPDGEKYYKYSLDIAWSLPEPTGTAKKKKWRWWPGTTG